jgi:hypothetical protein
MAAGDLQAGCEGVILFRSAVSLDKATPATHRVSGDESWLFRSETKNSRYVDPVEYFKICGGKVVYFAQAERCTGYMTMSSIGKVSSFMIQPKQADCRRLLEAKATVVASGQDMPEWGRPGDSCWQAPGRWTVASPLSHWCCAV